MISIFIDKAHTPDEHELQMALADNYMYWQQLHQFVLEKYPAAIGEWNYPGKNYGWSYRLKDKKRAIIYLLPRQGFFKAAFVFGGKATEAILNSDFPEEIKVNLQNARVYAEGRGLQVEVRDNANIPVIRRLVEIKLAH